MGGVYVIRAGTSSGFSVNKTTVKDDNGTGAFLYLDTLGSLKNGGLILVGETVEYIEDSIVEGTNSSGQKENYYIARYINGSNKNIYCFIKESNLNI